MEHGVTRQTRRHRQGDGLGVCGLPDVLEALAYRLMTRVRSTADHAIPGITRLRAIKDLMNHDE
jgi:hypothetical protein